MFNQELKNILLSNNLKIKTVKFNIFEYNYVTLNNQLDAKNLIEWKSYNDIIGTFFYISEMKKKYIFI